MIHWLDYGARQVAGQAVAAQRSGKFVQLRKGELEILCLATLEQAGFHAHIVERYCTACGIAWSKVGDKDRVMPQGALQVVGGGRYELDEKEPSLRLHGSSIAYGTFDRRGLAVRLRTVAELTGYRIDVAPAT